ncbi:hypothetical protein TG4357_01060 [Thalassovita gelatinovora]|uniref:Acetolactate synthase n=1 Tax=Thalassovita gelatinovora TaxID=53501 RepID=A0A0P1F8P0_THAGE|nr:DUF6497 family protein [Thalassovita gelatinovora]QIZ80226.1 hypothetical protein HFZ77_06950 [Thalassovita gelatinovora]CUH64086.1 hypothetical protein TG4357_01060 [Thalassovita gelatinovora]SEQ83046.1 hypothetical protein SAMN04488043_109101 [Thalassovita gelatinovora]
MHDLIKVFAACGGVLCWTSAATAVGQEEALTAVPSGLQLTLLDQFIEAQPDGTAWARFRFVVPELADGVRYDRVESDFPHLCAEFALPQLHTAGKAVSQIVISMSSKALEFGSTDPEVIQFFEAFNVETGRCIWEGF